MGAFDPSAFYGDAENFPAVFPLEGIHLCISVWKYYGNSSVGMDLFRRDDRDSTLVPNKEDPIDTKSKKAPSIFAGGQVSASSWKIETCYDPAEPVTDYSLFYGYLPTSDRDSRGDDPPV